MALTTIIFFLVIVLIVMNFIPDNTQLMRVACLLVSGSVFIFSFLLLINLYFSSQINHYFGSLLLFEDKIYFFCLKLLKLHFSVGIDRFLFPFLVLGNFSIFLGYLFMPKKNLSSDEFFETLALQAMPPVIMIIYVWLFRGF